MDIIFDRYVLLNIQMRFSQFQQFNAANANSNRRRWQKGDPIIEPQGAYRLHKGNIVLSRECD